MAISLMCGGDGLADIVGRRWGSSARLPWNPAKSWPGSAAMFLGAQGHGCIGLGQRDLRARVGGAALPRWGFAECGWPAPPCF